MCCLKSTVFICIGLLPALLCGQSAEFGGQYSESVTDSSNKKTVIKVEGSALLVDDAPFFPRIVQYNGEPFEFLKSLGFNTIQLNGPATEQQLRSAKQVGIWLVCPTPSFLRVKNLPSRYSPVLAWSLGNRVTGNQIQLIRERIADIKDADPQQRPVYVHAKSHWASYSQLVDVLGVGKPVIGTNARLSDYGTWVSQAGGYQIQPMWTDIQTQLPVALKRQAAAFSLNKTATPISHRQMKFQFHQAICAGSRGLRFLSRSPLNDDDPETRLRVMSLQWLLGQAEQIAPWVAGGLVRRKDSLSTADRNVYSITLPTSELLLIQRATGFEQWSCGDIASESVDFANLSLRSSDRVYRVNELGAVPLKDDSAVPQTRIKVPAVSYATTLLVTSDPIILSRLNSQLSGVPVGLQRRMELVRQSLGYAQLIEQQLADVGVGFPFVGGSRERASTDLATAQRLMQGGNYDIVMGYIRKADSSVAAIGKYLIETHLSSNEKLSTPLLMHPGLVPDHFLAAARFSGANWNANSLTAGDFENLQQMTQAGWKNRHDNGNGFTTRVELQQDAAVDGTYGLKMTVEGLAGSVMPDAAALWIESSPVQVKKGQLIRVNGFAQVLQSGSASSSLEIMDSISGQDLALHFSGPQARNWQQFTFYRVATRDTDVRLTFSLAGVGSAMIDEITVRTIDPVQTLGIDNPLIGERTNEPNSQIK